MSHQVVWFDIPVVDLDRAIRFYSAVLAGEVRKEQYPGMAIGVLPHAGQDVSGCLHVSPDSRPSENGPLLYFNCDGRLEAAVEAAERQGGRIIKGKHSIGPYGFRALVVDSEGNRIALHST